MHEEKLSEQRKDGDMLPETPAATPLEPRSGPELTLGAYLSPRNEGRMGEQVKPAEMEVEQVMEETENTQHRTLISNIAAVRDSMAS